MSKRRSPDTFSGVIVINKPEGVTSHRVVQILRRLYDTSRVGHTGTLDPMATGVLPVLIGRAAKASDYLTAEDKAYTARLTLGLATDTQDITGQIIRKCDEIPPDSIVEEVISSFVGEISQIPPMYSAIKIGGEKLVDMARQGRSVERPARNIVIKDIRCEKIGERDWLMEVECSKGTYIRTLCNDIGEKLGCGGVMSALRRDRSGAFTLSDAYSLEKIEELSLSERVGVLRPTESLFSELPSVNVNDFYAKLVRGGTELYLKKLGISYEAGQRLRIKHGGEFIAFGRVEEFEKGLAVKPVKLFVL